MLSAQEAEGPFYFIEENRNLRFEIQAAKLVCERKEETLQKSIKCLSQAQHFCTVVVNMMKNKGLYEGFEVRTSKFGWDELVELIGTPSSEELQKLEKKLEEMYIAKDLMKKKLIIENNGLMPE